MPMSEMIHKAPIVNREHGHRTSTSARLMYPFISFWMLLFLMATGITASAQSVSYYVVDCSGANASDYPTIASALAVAGPNSYIILASPCTENVFITNASNLNLAAFYGQTVAITGNVSVAYSNNVFLYGLNVTNPSGDAFDISSSQGTALWTCTGNGSSGTGLSVFGISDVTVDGPSSFDNNGKYGMWAYGNSAITVQTWGGPVDISNNQGPGVELTIGGNFETLGNTTIENNVTLPTAEAPNGYGVQLLSIAKAQFGTCYGPNQISGNQNGGIDAEENSELSIWDCSTSSATTVSGNGPVGISAGLGSQVTLWNNAQITGHNGPGVELYGESQLRVFKANLIAQNGDVGDPRSAGIVVDGNSEAYLRGGTIENNKGPGILALVNSSVDLMSATFADNSGGALKCDSSAYMVSDLSAGWGVDCKTPHHLGNRRGFAAVPRTADLMSAKNRAMRFKGSLLTAGQK